MVTRARADEIGYDAFAGQFSGTIQGAVNMIQAALPDFARLGSGRVINIGTNLFQHPVVPYHDYTAAKAALLSLTRTFAADLGPRRITVNMVSGGLLRTTDASAATPQPVFDRGEHAPSLGDHAWGVRRCCAVLGLAVVASGHRTESRCRRGTGQQLTQPRSGDSTQ